MALKSAKFTQNIEFAPARSLFYAMGYTKEEIKTLKEELLRLRCQEEFSKKFEALAQDYLKKKNSN